MLASSPVENHFTVKGCVNFENEEGMRKLACHVLGDLQRCIHSLTILKPTSGDCGSALCKVGLGQVEEYF